MGKRNKKKYTTKRDMNLVCLDCNRLFRECDCKSSERTAFILANRKELEHFFATGLVPDYKAELLHCEGQKKPSPIPLTWPPKYDFKID
jgi:hypothetical protein